MKIRKKSFPVEFLRNFYATFNKIITHKLFLQ
jgi:hypothetical protein